MLDPSFGEYRKQGAELDGVGLDDYFVNARSLDFSKAHMAFTDYPVSFAAADYRPVIVGDTIMCEWTRELKRRLEARGKWLMANTCRQAFPFAQHLLDMNGIEWGLRTEAVIARTLAYHKQVLSLPVEPEHYQEPFIKEHLVMGVFPGGYGGDKNLRPETPAARLYATCVPIIKRMAAAGWEPIPWAVSDPPDPDPRHGFPSYRHRAVDRCAGPRCILSPPIRPFPLVPFPNASLAGPCPEKTATAKHAKHTKERQGVGDKRTISG